MDEKVVKAAPHEAEITLHFLGWVLIGYALVRGIAILFEGVERWGGESFNVALMLPGSPPSWGTVYVGAGIVSIVGAFYRRWARLVTVGLYVAGGWTFFFALTFLLSAIHNPGASLGGILSNAVLGIIYIVVGVGIREVRKA